jgi:glyoxylase-like metal-dependent hydrolase (beta-lactamase superfamily II)
MKPATRLIQFADGLYGWSSFHAQWKIDFHSYAVKTPDGVALVDPMKPGPSVLKKLDALGTPVGVFLTNAHHDRDADWFRKHYGIQVYAHEKARSDCDTKIDVLALDGEKLPGGLKVVPLPGSTPGGIAFYLKQAGGIVMLGDSLLHVRGKGLSLLPEQYLENIRQTRQSLKTLLNLTFKILTFAHGAPLTENAKRQLYDFL